MSDEAEDQSFLELLTGLANKTDRVLEAAPDNEARFSFVQKLVGSADMAIAVWEDREVEEGIGYMVIKGKQLAREALAGDQGGSALGVVIPGNDEDQAEELWEDLGETTAATSDAGAGLATGNHCGTETFSVRYRMN